MFGLSDEEKLCSSIEFELTDHMGSKALFGGIFYVAYQCKSMLNESYVSEITLYNSIMSDNKVYERV